jgi:hypothetical protein
MMVGLLWSCTPSPRSREKDADSLEGIGTKIVVDSLTMEDLERDVETIQGLVMAGEDEQLIVALESQGEKWVSSATLLGPFLEKMHEVLGQGDGGGVATQRFLRFMLLRREQLPIVEGYYLMDWAQSLQASSSAEHAVGMMLAEELEVAHASLSKRYQIAIDSNFDPERLPVLNASPGGNGLPGGAAPGEIVDATKRAEYERIIEEARQYAIYYERQVVLRALPSKFPSLFLK